MFFGDFTLHTPKTRPPTSLGHDAPGSAFEGVSLCPNSASEASCGHTRRGIASSSCTGVRPRPQAIPECSRLKRALLEVAAELLRSVRVCERSAFSFFFGLSGRLGTARRVVRGWITLTRRQQVWRTLATGALKRWIRGVPCGGRLERRGYVCRRGSRPTLLTSGD